MKLTPRQLKELRREPVGIRLGAACRIAGVTQAKAAADLRLTPQYLSDVSCGRYHGISVTNASVFADYFGCSIEDLFPSLLKVAV